MEWVALITLLIGSVLGVRFRVFILLPAILATMAVITVGALVQGAGIGTISVMNVIGAACLQFGYLGGVLLWSRTSSQRLDETGRPHPVRPFTS